MILGHPHFFKKVRILNIIGQGVCQNVMKTFRNFTDASIALGLTAKLPYLVKVLSIPLMLLLPLFFFVSIDLLRQLRIFLKLLFLLQILVLGYVLFLSLILNLTEQFIFILHSLLLILLSYLQF